jgi:hypothetical protein
MFGLTFGELFIVVFITLAVVTASFWPRVFGELAVRLQRLVARDRGPGANTNSSVSRSRNGDSE